MRTVTQEIANSKSEAFEGMSAGFVSHIARNNSIESYALMQRKNAIAQRNNALLPIQAFNEIDQAVASSLEAELNAFDDLAALPQKKLTSIGITVYNFQYSEGFGPAEQSIEAIKRGELQKMGFAEGALPVPVTFVDWDYGARALAASTLQGTGIETAGANSAGQSIGLTLESNVLYGSGVRATDSRAGTQAVAYGYMNHPNRITGTLGGDWTSSLSTVEADISAMAAALMARHITPPYVLYTSLAVWNDLQSFANADKTLRYIDLIRQDARFSDVRFSKEFTDDDVVAVKLDPRYVQLVHTSDVTTLQWDDGAGMLIKFKTLGIMIPLIRPMYYRTSADDYAVTAGLAHYSTP